MQYQLDRSPRSNPIVSFCSPKLLVCFVAAVLTFFIAGLLYLLCFKHVDNLGAYSIPSETGLLNHLIATGVATQVKAVP